MSIREGSSPLEDIERALLSLADSVQSPLSATTKEDVIGSILGDRGRLLYLGVLHAARGPSAVTALHDVRALVEAAILARWLSLEPSLNISLWVGQAEDSDLRAIRQMAEHLPTPADEHYRLENMPEVVDRKSEIVKGARAAAQAASRDYGSRIMPSLEKMVREIELAQKEQAWAIRQAYDALYRYLSPFSHTEASSFKFALEERAEGFLYVPGASPMPEEHLRSVAASCFAYLLEAVADLMGNPSLRDKSRMSRDQILEVPLVRVEAQP